MQVLTWEGDFRGWQDKLGYMLSDNQTDQDYVQSHLLQNMTLLSDDNGCRYYRTQEGNEKLVGVTSTQPVSVPKKLPNRTQTRTITTREVTFVCARCGDTNTQQRFPGPLPLYCSDHCKKTAQREQTRSRVRAMRKRRKANILPEASVSGNDD